LLSLLSLLPVAAARLPLRSPQLLRLLLPRAKLLLPRVRLLPLRVRLLPLRAKLLPRLLPRPK